MAAEFTLFNKLPAEIRMLIWEATLPRRYIFCPFYRPLIILGPPAIAQVCRESRAIALKNGSPHFLMGFCEGYDVLTWYDPSRDSLLCDLFRLNPYGHTEPFPRPLLVRAMTSMMHQERHFSTDFENHQANAKQLARRLGLMCMERQNIRVVNLVLYPNHVKLHALRGEFPGQRHWKPSIIDAIFGIDMIRFVDLEDEKEVESISQILYSHQGSIGDGSELVRAHAAVRSIYKAREQSASQHEEPLSNLKYWDVLMRDFKYHWLIDRYEHDHETDSSAVRLYPGQPIDEANSWIKKTIAKIPEIRPVFLFQKENTQVSYYLKGTPKVTWNGQAWERTQ
ncbi:hypothetical protein DL770_002871 [Monosporascus sp. CRB-9-2]|nr:hypothetical protein DL770_002871 [Monosporascus sp. CRB-9-2]